MLLDAFSTDMLISTPTYRARGSALGWDAYVSN